MRYNAELDKPITAIKEALAKPEQKQVPVKWINDTINIVIEQVASWLESECDEQYLADRVRAGDYVKEKGCTENRAALADNCLDHLPPSLVGVGEIDSTSQPEQEPVTYSGNGTAGREADARPTGFFFQMPQRKPLTDEECGALDRRRSQSLITAKKTVQPFYTTKMPSKPPLRH